MTKKYDNALTPLNHLLTSHNDMVDPHDLTALQTLLRDTDIEQLKHKISNIQANLLELARRRGQTDRRARTRQAS